jgi:tellurite resistance protein TehA-like permease
VLFGVPVLGFALLWMCIAGALTARVALAPARLPFAPTWWAFTFPVGTCVTGAAALARLTGAEALAGLSVLLYAGLVVAWLVVIIVGLRAVGRSARRPSDAWAYSI